MIGLPSNLFYGAGIPAALLIFDKSREPKGKDDIFFIDASNEFEKGSNQNRLRTEDIDKIVSTYHDKKVIEKYSDNASFAKIEENEFNLNIPRYVDTFEPEPQIDIEEVQGDIARINKELAEVESKLEGYLKELDY